MARIWANSGGTWATDTIWDVLEDGASEITHRVPVNGDYVYANGYSITSVPLNCTGIIISNEANADYGVNAGGSFATVGATNSINARFKEIHQGGGTICINIGNAGNSRTNELTCEKITNTDAVAFNLSWGNHGGYVSITAQEVRCHYNLFSVSGSNTTYTSINLTIADCIMYGSATLINGSNIGTLNYTGNYTGVLNNGNITTFNFTGSMVVTSLTDRTITTLTANGAYTLTGTQTITTGYYYGDLTLNDGTTISGTTGRINRAINIGNNCVISYTNLTFNDADGIVRVGHGSRYSATTHTFNGRKIEYYNDSNGIGGITSTNPFTPINTDFQWVNISEPRTLKYRIMTDYDFDNIEQYPPENRVVAGTPYAFDEKVGTFAVDYPPETVVLKDYVYDGGEMVGTLDLPQAPTTSDIVTAIKNDSDLGGKINDITTNTENIKSDTENIISNTNTIENIVEDIQISTNNILSESSSINNKSDSIITTLNNTSPQINDLWNRLNDVLTARLGQSVTVEILEEVLTSQLNNQ